jgi:hypothetical protein
MTSGVEVDDLLEPVWSWPEPTTLAPQSAKGCPAAEQLPPSDREDHGATHRSTNPTEAPA